MLTENRLVTYLQTHHQIALNPQQKQAVLSDDRYLLLLAVPGSGKTTVLVSHIAHLIVERQIPPEQILTLTFSRESANDMRQRFQKLFASIIPEPPRFSTIHSFCYTVLQTYAKLHHRSCPKLLADSGDTVSKAQLLRQLYQDINQDFLTDDLLESVSNDISLAKNGMYSRADIRKMDTSVAHFEELMQRYDAVKKEHHLMDFDDMLTYAYDLLRKLPKLLERFRRQYPYIHVDEAQDTSKIQYAILDLFAPSSHLFVVGDEDQCIYAFRGAYPEGLLAFEHRYPDAKVLKIEQNYRSHADIVQKANEFIQINKKRYPKEMFCDNEYGNSIVYRDLDDYSKQYSEILRMVQNKPEGETLAVLYRNNESAIPILDLFRRNGISYYIKERNLRFFSSFVVRDIMAFFTLAYDPKNIKAFEQIYYKCMCAKSVFLFVKYNVERFSSVFEAAAHCPEILTFQIPKMNSYAKELERMKGKRPFSAIQQIETKFGYAAYLAKRASGGQNPVNAALKLNILKTMARHYEDIESFAQNLHALDQSLRQESAQHPAQHDSAAAITLISIHSSKGLEFDTVLLVDALDSILPDVQAIEEADAGHNDAMEGEARLFYVAVTRAKSKLVLFTSTYCNDEYVLKSRFITRMKGEKARSLQKGDSLTFACKGKRLHHELFGDGVAVSDCNDDLIHVYFSKVGAKMLSYSTCIQQGTLELFDEEEQ